VIGVVMSGTGDDGTAGLAVIRARGGIAVAQAPDSASFGQMPGSAIAAGVVDHVAPLDEMAALLTRLVGVETSRGANLSPQIRMETRMSDLQNPMGTNEPVPGLPSPLTCPDCGGVLQRIDDGVQPLHFRCQVGHGWGMKSLDGAQREQIEFTLWAALRGFVEQAKLMDELARQAEARESRSAARYRERAAEAHAHAATLRALLASSNDAGGSSKPDGR
jgi:two-component system chemotaxis response regulator CheB